MVDQLLWRFAQGASACSSKVNVQGRPATATRLHHWKGGFTACAAGGAGKHIGEHPMSYSVKSVSLGVFLWLRQAGNMALFCNEVSTVRCAAPCPSPLPLAPTCLPGRARRALHAPCSSGSCMHEVTCKGHELEDCMRVGRSPGLTAL